MTDQTVTLCIEGDRRQAIPFAVVPFMWVRQYQGDRRFKFEVPRDQEELPFDADAPEPMVEISVEIIQMQLPNGGTHTKVNLWCVAGAEHLVGHPKVATFPEAREMVIAGMN